MKKMWLIGLNLSLKPNNSDLGAFLFSSNFVFWFRSQFARLAIVFQLCLPIILNKYYVDVLSGVCIWPHPLNNPLKKLWHFPFPLWYWRAFNLCLAKLYWLLYRAVAISAEYWTKSAVPTCHMCLWKWTHSWWFNRVFFSSWCFFALSIARRAKPNSVWKNNSIFNRTFVACFAFWLLSFWWFLSPNKLSRFKFWFHQEQRINRLY